MQEVTYEYTVSDAIVQELRREGVDVIYGIVSVHNMPIYNAILNDGHIRTVTARGESAAVNMADAYARSTGKLGVVLTSTGTGAGNAAGSLAETWNAGAPVLHITGEMDAHYIGTDQRFIHESKDQLKMMDGVSKSAYMLQLPDQTTTFMQHAIQDAQTVPTGPVTVQFPINLQTKIIPNNQLYAVESEQVDTAINLPEGVIEQISKAKRPVIWAGGGVIQSGGSEELLKLVEKVNPAVVTSASGKGGISEAHPLNIGNFIYYAETEKLINEADLLISIGTRFRAGDTNGWMTPVPDNHINIDADPNAFNRNFNARYSLCGDAKAVLQEINDQLKKLSIQPDETYQDEVKAVRKSLHDTVLNEVKPYDTFVESFQKHVPEDIVLVTDVTLHGYTWADKLININGPGRFLHMAGEGIGQGLPMAIGAKVAHPDKPVVLVAGDGGFMVNAGELITAAQENTAISVLLFDDGGYGILRYYQDAAYDQTIGVNLQNPDFVTMAQSMGFEAEKITSAENFENSFSKALNSEKPSMLVIDTASIGKLVYEDSEEYIESFHPQSE